MTLREINVSDRHNLAHVDVEWVLVMVRGEFLIVGFLGKFRQMSSQFNH